MASKFASEEVGICVSIYKLRASKQYGVSLPAALKLVTPCHLSVNL